MALVQVSLTSVQFRAIKVIRPDKTSIPAGTVVDVGDEIEFKDSSTGETLTRKVLAVGLWGHQPLVTLGREDQ